MDILAQLPTANSGACITILGWSILVPLFIGIFLLISGKLGERFCRPLALLGFAVPAACAINALLNFSPNESGYAFLSDCNLGLDSIGISLKLGLNGIALPLYVLAGIVGMATGLFALQHKLENKTLYIGLLLFMQAGLMGVFSSIDIFFFYFFHEFALIPTFILIGIWGGVGRKVAAMEMTIYLTFGAMLSLIGLIMLYVNSGLQTFDFIALREHLASTSISEGIQENIYAFLLFGFGILVSLFPFHTWAPRGYAAAPTPATMLHAGVLKKFGLYGLIQFAAVLLPAGNASYVEWILWLALGNVILIGLITIAQKKLRLMLGYASVMHMGYAFLAIATMTSLGMGGAVLMLFAHGLSIALLFLLQECIYKRTGTDLMDEMGGLSSKAPILSGLFVAAIMASIGLPGFANFWGELAIYAALFQAYPAFAAAAILGIIISAIYGLRAISKVFFGPLAESLENKDISDITLGEKIPAFILLLGLLIVGIYPSIIGNELNIAVEKQFGSVETQSLVESIPSSKHEAH